MVNRSKLGYGRIMWEGQEKPETSVGEKFIYRKYVRGRT